MDSLTQETLGSWRPKNHEGRIVYSNGLKKWACSTCNTLIKPTKDCISSHDYKMHMPDSAYNKAKLPQPTVNCPHDGCKYKSSNFYNFVVHQRTKHGHRGSHVNIKAKFEADQQAAEQGASGQQTSEQHTAQLHPPQPALARPNPEDLSYCTCDPPQQYVHNFSYCYLPQQYPDVHENQELSYEHLNDRQHPQ